MFAVPFLLIYIGVTIEGVAELYAQLYSAAIVRYISIKFDKPNSNSVRDKDAYTNIAEQFRR